MKYLYNSNSFTAAVLLKPFKEAIFWKIGASNFTTNNFGNMCKNTFAILRVSV